MKIQGDVMSSDLKYEEIFKPGKIGKMEVPNRLVVPAMATMYADEDGKITDRLIKYHEAKARGGWGLIITEDQVINKGVGGFPNLPGLWNDDQIEGQKKLTDAVHKWGSKIVAQIYHAGRQTTKAVSGKQPVAPSPIPDPVIGEVPRELEVEEIKNIIEDYANAAINAKKSDYDAVEVHGAHGYLISEFLSPYSNKRTDEYGGNLENRARFALETVRAIKNKTGKDYPVIFRISVDELVYGGLNVEDTKLIALMLEKEGVNAIHASVGVNASQQYTIAPSSVGHAWAVKYAEAIHSVVNIPVITVNRITHPAMAENILSSGRADFVAMGRASLADPELPKKTIEGRTEDINFCVGCLQGCIGLLAQNKPITCLVNPSCGHETEFALEKVATPKKVMIAGGGPAGMEAAIFAAKRGHEVHLFERSDKLGGQWLLAAIPPGKEDLNQLVIWQKNQIKELGVNVKLNTNVNNELIKNVAPDVLIVATGTERVPSKYPGADGENIVFTNDVLSGGVNVGKKVLVVGGDFGGPQTAEHLAIHGHDVTLITKNKEIAPSLVAGTQILMLEALKKNNVQIMTDKKILSITEEGALTENEDQTEELKGFDTVVITTMLKPIKDQFKEFEESLQILEIGDDTRNGLDAVRAGYEAGMKI